MSPGRSSSGDGPDGGLGAGWSEGVGVLVGVGEFDELFAACEGLFAFDFGADAGVAGPGVAFEHLNRVVSEGDCTGDGAARAAGDEPGQSAAELAGLQPKGAAVDVGMVSVRWWVVRQLSTQRTNRFNQLLVVPVFNARPPCSSAQPTP